MGRAALLVVVTAVAGGLGIAATGVESLGDRASLVGAILLVVAAALPMLARLRKEGLDGPGIYAFVAAIELGLLSLTWLGTPPGPGPGLTRPDIVQALLVVAAGMAAFALGARVAGPARRSLAPALPENWRPNRGALIVAFGFAILGALVGAAEHQFGYVASSGPSSIGQLLSFFQVLGGVIVLVTALLYFRYEHRGLRTLLVAFTVLQLALGFLSGVKTTTVEPLLFICLAYRACRGRFPWRGIVLAALFTFVVVVPLATSYRQAVREQSETASQALSSALSTSGGGISHAVSSAYAYVIGRFREIDSVALIVARTPSEYPYGNGSLYFELPAIIVVPRQIWSSKPQLDEALQFTHTYWEAPTIDSSTPLTSIGDLYRDFGINGVIVGMLILGLVIAYWTRLWSGRRSLRFDVVYLFSLLYFVANVEDDLPEVIATAAKTLPLVAIVSWLLLPGRNGSQPGYRRLLNVREGRRVAAASQL